MISTSVVQPTKSIVTRTSEVWLREDGILHVVQAKDSHQTGADAVENIAACVKIAGGQKRACMIDFRGVRSQDRDARAYYAGPETAAVLSTCALVVGSPLARMLANLYMGLNKTIMPTRMFTSEDEAVLWLKTIIS